MAKSAKAKKAKAGGGTRERVVLLLFADTHGGHRLGLMSPDVVLLDEAQDGSCIPYTPELTATQAYLWECYREDIGAAKEFAGDDEIIVIHDGDATQGSKYPQHLVSNRVADQIIIGVANLEPVIALPNVKTARLAKGTSSHVMGEGSSELLITAQLQAKHPNKNIGAVYHGSLDVDGAGIDYAHHGPFPGSREWLRGNVARYYLRDLMMRDIMAGKDPPHLVVRGHYHALVTETVTIRANGSKYVSQLVVLPSYCGMGEHGHRATRSIDRITNGMVLYEIIRGELNQSPRELVRTLDIRTREAV